MHQNGGFDAQMGISRPQVSLFAASIFTDSYRNDAFLGSGVHCAGSLALDATLCIAVTAASSLVEK